MPKYLLVWMVWAIVLGVAVFLTARHTKNEPIGWKVAKFAGIVVSTMPILGLLQGLAARSKAPDYARACLWQAGAGMVAYIVIQGILSRA